MSPSLLVSMAKLTLWERISPELCPAQVQPLGRLNTSPVRRMLNAGSVLWHWRKMRPPTRSVSRSIRVLSMLRSRISQR